MDGREALFLPPSLPPSLSSSRSNPLPAPHSLLLSADPVLVPHQQPRPRRIRSRGRHAAPLRPVEAIAICVGAGLRLLPILVDCPLTPFGGGGSGAGFLGDTAVCFGGVLPLLTSARVASELRSVICQR